MKEALKSIISDSITSIECLQNEIQDETHLVSLIDQSLGDLDSTVSDLDPAFYTIWSKTMQDADLDKMNESEFPEQVLGFLQKVVSL